MRGVGLVGAGPGGWALHAPTLARLGGVFRLVHVADGGSGRAAEIAAAWGARSSAGIDGLLADPAVEVVAICSPPDAHAAQILAAVDAGVRVILCEKPLATSIADAERVIERCREARVALVVGTHHLFDPAWGRATHHLTALSGQVRSVTVTLALPPNDRYHRVVSDAALPPSPPRPRPDLSNAAVAAQVARALVSGLVIHDLPLVRDLARGVPQLTYATLLPPIGVALGWTAGEVAVRSSAVMVQGGADALWRLTVQTDRDRLDIAFPPAFVHAGSATVTVRSADGTRTIHPADADDGYVAEWRNLAALARGEDVVEYDEILADARFAIDLADAAAAAIGSDS
ncbi:Gfo/Idh/MocA family oxidoreductase [Microbacterium sp. ET2]|uniref:Gfo/Idh/MocA family protein n=1 Tax=Microbacterium albipurpureum TaxID=3050384 RepID=UPI00259C6D9C|nr:Gfo/Idh/MocA family oxidoreductase [Microbacterium sp. ET2 (Ac-2212)]WJL94468.1 Gfo/Idh/MocA family oxidoreductase [Microbacterium sp. ET2 (Ac-2212)]